MDIKKIQPSQLYINQSKLENLERQFNPDEITSNHPLPIKKQKEQIFFTDGHTRAFMYYKAGKKEIPVYWDEDELDMELYMTCLGWCKENKIHFIGDLKDRILPNEIYKELWINRCKKYTSKRKEE
ncbi:hypothetical protein BACCIP111883_02310 [Sutcliffiella rhizosphaerae]|uniref:Histone acetyltransferase n=2 Tax=Sutcliffiella rhizosphaerae TaxID=2880967 RepID=A0ABN8ACV5_9BACI|nr:hypothetical protein BACCIP111883_02310 [Sutcliffiella rhizosphaerae]